MCLARRRDGKEETGIEGKYLIPRGVIGSQFLWPDALPVAN